MTLSHHIDPELAKRLDKIGDDLDKEGFPYVLLVFKEHGFHHVTNVVPGDRTKMLEAALEEFKDDNENPQRRTVQ